MNITNLKLFLRNYIFSKYSENMVWLFIEKVLRLVLGLFIGVWVARYLGPVRYGQLNYSQSFVILFSAISNLGLNDILIRELAKSNDIKYKEKLLGTSFLLKLLGSFIMILLIFAITSLTSNELTTNILILIISFCSLFQSFNVIDLYFQYKILSKFVVWANILSICVTSTIKLILILQQSSVIYFALVILLESIISSCGLIFFYIKNGLSLRSWKYDIKTAFNLIKNSWPLMFAFMSYVMYSRIDQVMLKELLGNKSVGLYAAAYRLYELPLFLPAIMVQSIFPKLVELYNNNYNKFIYLCLKITSLMTFLSYTLVIISFFFSSQIIYYIFGNRYSSSSHILAILSIGLIPIFNAILRSTFITISNNQKIIFYTTLLSAILNVILNYIMIPHYGVSGAAYATVITQIISLFASNFCFKETRPIFVLQIKSLLLLGLK